MRWITRQTTFGFVDDNAVLVDKRFAPLIFVFRRLRTSRKCLAFYLNEPYVATGFVDFGDF